MKTRLPFQLSTLRLAALLACGGAATEPIPAGEGASPPAAASTARAPVSARTTTTSKPKRVVRVDCSPVNDFGYVGWAEGELEIGDRDPTTLLPMYTVRGTLALRYGFYGEPETERTVEVSGLIDATGDRLSALVETGADDLYNVYFTFVKDDGTSSAINAHLDAASYQTDCSATRVYLPEGGSDLVAEGTIRYYAQGDGSIGVNVQVRNIGDEPTTGPTGRTTIAGNTVASELHSNAGATTLAPGERGYLYLQLPGTALARCQDVEVTLDVDHTYQCGDPDPFPNDTATLPTPCLGWSTPITEDAISPVPDPVLAGKTLGAIVGGFEVGRTDGQRCSNCHHQASGRPFLLPVDPGGSHPLLSTDVINGTSWAAPGGWASAFLAAKNPPKPEYLKILVQQWLDDGARP